MRRKIEKYLAKKQGVLECNIRYTDDGRFDFMGDLEGVLSAVRGKDPSCMSATRSRGGRQESSHSHDKKKSMYDSNNNKREDPLPNLLHQKIF